MRRVLEPARCWKVVRGPPGSWMQLGRFSRRYSRKNERITSPVDLIRKPKESLYEGISNFPELDPISGGLRHSSKRNKTDKRTLKDYRNKNSEANGENILYGVSPVYAALLAGRREISQVLIQEGLIENLSKKKKDPRIVNEILNICKEKDFSMAFISKHDLNMLTDNKPHQGVVLRTSAVKPTAITSLPRVNKFKCVLALDEVTDPQNLGALIRSYYFLNRNVFSGSDDTDLDTEFGSTACSLDVGVVLCQKNSAPLSPTVSKASSGALENMTIYSTKNMMKFLEQSKENGWHVVGTSSYSRDRNVLPLNELSMERPIIVVLGNEGHGVRKNILNRCETLVSITSRLQSKKISLGSSIAAGCDLDYVDSLNVSVCGGIILHHIMLNA